MLKKNPMLKIDLKKQKVVCGHALQGRASRQATTWSAWQSIGSSQTASTFAPETKKTKLKRKCGKRTDLKKERKCGKASGGGGGGGMQESVIKTEIGYNAQWTTICWWVRGFLFFESSRKWDLRNCQRLA